MADLYWPGDERAGELFSDGALLGAMIRVEAAWLEALVGAGVAPAAAGGGLDGLAGVGDLPDLAAGAEAGGNPVIPLLSLLRDRLADRPAAGAWLHRGLTSQDTLDTALMLCAGEVLARLDGELAAQTRSLVALAEAHRHTVLAGRTLTQHAVPVTFALKASVWLSGILDAAGAVESAGSLPAQFGGAAGTLAAPATLAAGADGSGGARRAVELAGAAAAGVGLHARPPWHGTRAPVTRLGDALVGCSDAFGRIANDVLTGSRPELGELAEPSAPGRGGSSAMPHKRNPVLSVLIRRAALAGPGLAAQLHLAAADGRDERPDGAWHLEWATLRTLARRTVTAASQTTELLAGLHVDAGRMATNARAAAGALVAERDRSRPEDATGAGEADPSAYLGAADLLVDATVERARAQLHRRPPGPPRGGNR